MRILKLSLVLAVLAAAVLAPAAMAQTTTAPGFQVQTSVSGYSQAVAMAYAPDGRVFTVQKRGRVHVARTDGTLAPTQILDLSAKVNSFGDRGMLGITLDKDFATNGFVYLLYGFELNPMSPDTAGPAVSRLTRIKVNADNTVANPTAPETVILGSYVAGPCPAPDNAVDCIPADYHWHTIGTVRTDPVDGTLWLGSGDGSSGATQEQALRTFDERSMSGKIMHIDRDGRGLPGHPFCPAETDLNKVCTKLYAKGFRNPFRFSLRPNKGPVVGDVGHTVMEEIDLVKPGRNYGWPCYEGTRRPSGYAAYATCQALYAKEGTADGVTFPDYTYMHGEAGASINGGPQYTGTQYPLEYRNDIFFGDYVQGWIKRLKVDANDNVLSVEPFAENVPAFVDMEMDPTGRLAFVDAGGFQAGLGAIRRFDYSGDLAPTARASATPTTGAAPLAVQLTGNTSTDPEGKALTYDWDFGDGTAHATTANASHTYTANGSYTAKLTVKDPAGNANSATVKITVGNTPPSATITSPASTFTYTTGQTVQLSASGTDPQDGALPGTAYSWQVILHHGTHTHDHAAATGAAASFVTDAGHDADAYYEVRLTATDSGGLTDQKTVIIKPKTVKFALNSSPPGAPLAYSAGSLTAAPVRVTAAVGFKPSITAAETFVSGGRTYRFKGWSDGGARSHDATVPAKDSALLATYVADGIQTFTFTPTADAYVDAAIPTTNKGGSSQIGVDASPARQSLLRFDVSGLRGGRVVGTRLTLYGNNGSDKGGRILPVTGAWTETGVTWNTKPAFGTTQLGAFGSVRPYEWYDAALTGAVTGDGPVNLGMDTTSTDSALYSSRHQSEKPRLTVEVEPVPTTTLTFTPEADTSVSAAEPTRAFGASTTLWADNDPVRHTYLRFPVTGVGSRQILGAKLRMYQADSSRTGGQVKKLSSTGWLEGITWDTRPAIDGVQVGTFGAVARDQWYELELAPGAVTADGLVSFGITSTSTDSAGWRSRETAFKPELILTVPAG